MMAADLGAYCQFEFQVLFLYAMGNMTEGATSNPAVGHDGTFLIKAGF